jgi:hypothetical protein
MTVQGTNTVTTALLAVGLTVLYLVLVNMTGHGHP